MPGGEPFPQTLPWPLPSLRRALLEQTLQQAEFLHNCEEEEAWLRECTQLVEDTALGRDLNQIAVALQKQKVPATLCPGGPHFPAALPFPSPSCLLCTPPGPGSRAPQTPGQVRGSPAEGTRPARPRTPDAVGSPGAGRGGAGLVAVASGPGGRVGCAAAGGPARSAGRAAAGGGWPGGVCRVSRTQLPPSRSTSLMQQTRPRGYYSSSQRWRARPVGRIRQLPRPCCSATRGWSAPCAPLGPSCGNWMSRRGRPQPGHRLQ